MFFAHSITLCSGCYMPSRGLKGHKQRARQGEKGGPRHALAHCKRRRVPSCSVVAKR